MTSAAQAARARIYGRHCDYCIRRVPHPKRVKVILPGLTAWLARNT